MKLNKCFLFILILICSIVNINGNNPPKGIENLESSNDGKRTLDGQNYNYIIMQYNQEVSYGAKEIFPKFLNYILHIKKGGETIEPSSSFIVESGTKLEVYFLTSITNLESFLDGVFDTKLRNLISVDLSHFDKSPITSMKKMFSGCESLQSVDLSNVVISSVTTMEMMFFGCVALKNLKISNLVSSSSVTTMEMMFFGCRALQNLDLSNFAISSVTNMEKMFYLCSYLRNLKMSNFNTSKLTNMKEMFYGCSSLQNLDISNFITTSVRNMENMFYQCSLLKNLDLSNFVTSSVTSMYQMFYSCSSLQNLDISNFDTSSVVNMEYMFYNCYELKSLNLSNFVTSSVTNMHQMFYSCYSLKSLNLSNFVTSSVTNMKEMFSGCSALKYLIISNFIFDNINSDNMKDIFNSLSKLEYIDIYNIKDLNDIFKQKVQSDGLNSKDNLIVCQQNEIFTNPNADYKCCNIINDSLVCIIQTTIPIIQTTIPQIKATIPNIKTTITIPNIKTTITIPNIKTTLILKSILNIKTTIPQIQTTINQIQTSIPEARNDGTLLILLGFNSFKLSSSSISFNILFTQILNKIYSSLMKALLIINYNERIRILEEKEIDCYLKKTKSTDIVSYFCETEIKNSNIKKVQIIPNFDFINQNNVTVIGSTPFAKMYINNLQDIDYKYDNLENSIVYILDHSVFDKYSTYTYNITGTMNKEPKSKLKGKNINLLIHLESESKISIESGCIISNNNEISYTLNCELNENINGDLQRAISFINDEEILVVNFDNGNSIITINNPSKKYFSKSSSKSIKSGAIVAIVLSFVLVSATVIGIIIYLKHKKKYNEINASSMTIRNLGMN